MYSWESKLFQKTDTSSLFYKTNITLISKLDKGIKVPNTVSNIKNPSVYVNY